MIRFLPLLLLPACMAAAQAADWEQRLKASVEQIETPAGASFGLNCDEPFIEMVMTEFSGRRMPQDPKLRPRTHCLQGVFQNAYYHRRDDKDPLAYKTLDGKPYLELFFSNPGNYRQGDAPRPPDTIYTLKLILHDFRGPGAFTLTHRNETFRPRYDKDNPIARTAAGIPYLKYDKGAHIPLIIDHFVAMHENRAFTYSSGARIYGNYDRAAQYENGSATALGASDGYAFEADREHLGEILVDAIDKDGKISGSYDLRLLHETCSDPLASAHCKMASVNIRGAFTALPFRPDKTYLKQSLKLKPKLGGANNPGLKPKLKPRLGTGGQSPNAYTTFVDVPQPRLHKPNMGARCAEPVAGACGQADRGFERYAACMDEHNFTRSKTSDQASLAASRAALQGCQRIYRGYEQQARRCKQLFIDDDSCDE